MLSTAQAQAAASRAFLLINNNATLCLPTNANQDEVVRVAGKGIGWRIAQQADQYITTSRNIFRPFIRRKTTRIPWCM